MLAVGNWSYGLRQEQWAPCAEKLRVSGVYFDLLILAPTLAAESFTSWVRLLDSDSTG